MKIFKVALILLMFLFLFNFSYSQINVDNNRVLIIGSLYDNDSLWVKNYIYRGDPVKAKKKFGDAANRIKKFGTPVNHTDSLIDDLYKPAGWEYVFLSWLDVARSSKSFYLIPGKQDNMEECLLLYLTISKDINKVKEVSMEISDILTTCVPDEYYLLTELDTTRTVYYNTLCTRTVARKTCPIGYYGSKVQYRVPAKKYCSVISQSIAQAAAVAEADANKQKYADLIGVCIKK